MGLHRERMERAVNPRNASERARLERWAPKSLARVTHPAHGSIVVPHRSNLSAIMNAAEVWRCELAEITDATVYVAEPGAVPETMPYIIYK